MAKKKYTVVESYVDCTVYTDRKIELKSASQKDLEYLFKRGYDGVSGVDSEEA